MRQYRVRHRTTYRYASWVTIGYNELYLTPRTTPRQRAMTHDLTIHPQPARLQDRTDFFGNVTTYLELQELHKEFSVELNATVELQAPDPPAPTPSWEVVQQFVQGEAVPETVTFALPSHYARTTPAVEGFARPFFPPGRPILDAALDLMHTIYTDFKFKSGVTTIGTTQEEVLRDRQGVCQDFAHLQIAALRSMGLSARYVSGYLLTLPPPGQPRLVGADASHAWLSLFCGPDVGWVDLDPTNDLIPSDKHITLAWGTDYRDVSPVRGIVLGGGEQRLDVGVDVIPLEEEGQLLPVGGA